MYMMPQHILIAGASGLTGEHLLDRLLCEPTITRVLAPSRKALAEHPHLDNPQGELLQVLPQLKGPVDVAFCCLGTTLKQAGSKEAFRAVDYDLVIAFAQRALELGARHLVAISAVGADTRSTLFYNRVKGEMERALQAQDWPQLTIVRPSLLLGPRPAFRFAERLAAPFARLLPGKYAGISANTLAHAMWRLALEDGSGCRIIESDQLRRLGR